MFENVEWKDWLVRREFRGQEAAGNLSDQVTPEEGRVDDADHVRRPVDFRFLRPGISTHRIKTTISAKKNSL